MIRPIDQFIAKWRMSWEQSQPYKIPSKNQQLEIQSQTLPCAKTTTGFQVKKLKC